MIKRAYLGALLFWLGYIIMCNKCYEKLADKTGVNMLFCHDKDDEDSELLQLCICQRYCDQKEKYIPYNQKQGCKSYL